MGSQHSMVWIVDSVFPSSSEPVARQARGCVGCNNSRRSVRGSEINIFSHTTETASNMRTMTKFSKINHQTMKSVSSTTPSAAAAATSIQPRRKRRIYRITAAVTKKAPTCLVAVVLTVVVSLWLTEAALAQVVDATIASSNETASTNALSKTNHSLRKHEATTISSLPASSLSSVEQQNIQTRVYSSSSSSNQQQPSSSTNPPPDKIHHHHHQHEAKSNGCHYEQRDSIPSLYSPSHTWFVA